MPLFISHLFPYTRRDPNWQYSLAPIYDLCSEIICIEIKPGRDHIIDDYMQTDILLKKMVLVHFVPMGQPPKVILVTTTFDKQKFTSVLFGVHYAKREIVSIIEQKAQRLDLKIIFSTLSYLSYHLVQRPFWTLLTAYQPAVDEYYRHLHDKITDVVLKVLPQSCKRLEIAEIGCGFADSLRKVLAALPSDYAVDAQAIDLDEQNLVEASRRSADFPHIRFKQDNFLQTINNLTFFDRVYQGQAQKDPASVRIVISSGAFSIAILPTFSDLIFLLQDAYRHEVDLLLIGSVDELPLHSPFLKQIGYSLDVLAMENHFSKPLYILQRRAPANLKLIAVPVYQTNYVHLNLKACSDPIAVLTRLSSAQKNSVMSIDLSYCQMTSTLMSQLERVLAEFPFLRNVFHHGFQRARYQPENNDCESYWQFMAYSMQDIMQNYFFSKTQIHNKMQIFQGIHNSQDLIPSITQEDCKTIMYLHNTSGLPVLPTNTGDPFTLKLLEKATTDFPLLWLILICRYKTGHMSEESVLAPKIEVPNASGYVGHGVVCATYNFVGELSCYQTLQQHGFFSKQLLQQIISQRIRDLGVEYHRCESSIRESNPEYQQQVQKALVLYRSAQKV